MPNPLTVDGVRPSVAWVSTLPPEWTTAHQRLVLLVLACDAYDGISAPGGDDLATWCGLSRSAVYRILGQLQQATDARPPLIAKVNRWGKPVGNQRRGGRSRTRYRLLIDAQLSPHTGQLDPETQLSTSVRPALTVAADNCPTISDSSTDEVIPNCQLTVRANGTRPFPYLVGTQVADLTTDGIDQARTALRNATRKTNP